MSICMLVYHMCAGACRNQKRTSDPQLELKAIADATNQTQVFCKSSQCSKPLSHFPTFQFKKVLVNCPAGFELAILPQPPQVVGL